VIQEKFATTLLILYWNNPVYFVILSANFLFSVVIFSEALLKARPLATVLTWFIAIADALFGRALPKDTEEVEDQIK